MRSRRIIVSRAVRRLTREKPAAKAGVIGWPMIMVEGGGYR